MAGSRKFSAPRGTRDFYPLDMAVRRHVENAWRSISINHGFDEIEGPTFEHLDLYTHKSGPGIVSELFSFKRAGGETDYALRPEFTPTLARMVAARAGELPRPIKWFAIPSHFRAERPQRGRLREFIQWNVDFIGEASPMADAEVIAVAIGALERLGLTPNDVQVKISDRAAAASFLRQNGVAESKLVEAFDFIDKHDRYAPEQRETRRQELGISQFTLGAFEPGLISLPFAKGPAPGSHTRPEVRAFVEAVDQFIGPLRETLESLGVAEWCRYDNGIVRGLAYYTGTVFEIHETTGAERAIAGGGRYDRLIESFGGPSLPACGFGMGDVVLGLVLQDRGLLKPEESMPRPDAFVIAAGSPEADQLLPRLVSQLRRRGLHARQSYKATRNIGKLLGDAAKLRARYAVILGAELAAGNVTLKNLATGEQSEIPLASLPDSLGPAPPASPASV